METAQEMCSIGPVPHQALDCSVALYKRIWVKALVMLLGQNEGEGPKLVDIPFANYYTANRARLR